jgi:hypothetical protein
VFKRKQLSPVGLEILLQDSTLQAFHLEYLINFAIDIAKAI